MTDLSIGQTADRPQDEDVVSIITPRRTAHNLALALMKMEAAGLPLAPDVEDLLRVLNRKLIGYRG